SALFKKIYEEEYGQLGGTPYGMLVGDYDFGRSAEDISLLTMISRVAAAAHAPFVAAVSPKMFNMERFDEMPEPRDLARIFESVEYAAWKSFRESEDSRYAALTLPRVLARPRWLATSVPADKFAFEELAEGNNPLWMSAAWAFAARVTGAVARW